LGDSGELNIWIWVNTYAKRDGMCLCCFYSFLLELHVCLLLSTVLRSVWDSVTLSKIAATHIFHLHNAYE
jgi:hypothetical protein